MQPQMSDSRTDEPPAVGGLWNCRFAARFGKVGGIAGLVLLSTWGCESTAVPPTQGAVSQAKTLKASTTAPKGDAVTLAGPMPREQAADTPVKRGRTLFLNRCTACHEEQPISEFSMDEWNQDILPVMTARAKLKPDQISDLKAYIVLTHSMMEK